MKRLLLLPFLFCYSFLVKAQVQPVSCDLFLSSAEITDLSGNTLDANLISFNQVVKFQITIGNSDIDDAAPSGHFRVTIGLGSGFTLNPGFNLATAPLSNIFNWSYDLSGSQPRIIGISKAALPPNAAGTAEFELKATTAANSFVSGNFQISNPVGTQTPLSDPDFSNNNTLNNYNIAQDLILTINSQQNVSCFGGNNGSITASATGGYTPYTFSISPAAGTQATLGVFTNLPANTYTVTVTDVSSNNNSKSTQIIITQPAAITAGTASKMDANCFGASTGSITLIGAGGTAPYAYTITGTGSNNSGATSGNFINLPAGTYGYSITDANMCTPATGSLTVGQPAVITAGTASKMDANCFGATTGSITLVGAGGTAPYAYTITGTGSNISGATSGMFTGLPAGSYNYSITDANMCAPATGTLTVGQPAAITAATATKMDANCFGASTGSITLAGAGGTAPYAYTITGTGSNISGATTGMFTGLPAGTYTYSITDANMCAAATGSLTVGQPVAITTATATKTDATCNGVSNGTITLLGSGGTSPYAYTITGTGSNSSGATTGMFTGLAAGTYNYSITDANMCAPATGSLTVNQPAAITAATATKTDANCFGASTGSVTLSGAGGTSPYMYTITGTGSNNSGMTTGVFTGLIAGTYNYSITDANNCAPATGSLTVGQPTAITAATATKTDANCFGASTGSITLAGAGGTSPYTYTITGTGSNNTGATTGIFTGLAAGAYNYSITDANMCAAATATLTVSQPATITAATATKTDANCFGASTGSITLAGAGGTPPYAYTIAGTGSNNSGATTGMFTGLGAGTYNYSITDANMCAAATGTLTVGQPAAITAATATKTDANCFGASTGSITLTGAGGTLPYAYTITGTGSNNTGATSGNFINLPAGTYSYSITDANMCTPATGSLIVGQPAAITAATATKTDANCNGTSTGSITLLGAGGTPPYAYTITGTGSNISGATSGMFTGLPAGTYSYSITDANMCTPATGTLTVGQPAALTSSITSQTNVACFGNSTGSVTVTGIGGTPGYSYTLSTTTNTSGTFTGLAAGGYSVTVTDANNCTTMQSVNITQPTAALIATETHTNVDCFGNSTGSATISATGGTGSYTGTGTFTGLAAGTYNYMVTDANGCTSSVSVTITQPIQVTINATKTNVSCFGAADGTITATASAGASITVNGQPYVANATYSPGNYNVVASAPNGNNNGTCTASTMVIITEPTKVTITGTATNVSCFSAMNGSLNGDASPGSTVTIRNSSNVDVTASNGSYGPGTYTATASASNGNNNGFCTASITLTITEPIQVTIMATSTNVTCNGAANGKITATASVGATITVNGNPYDVNTMYGPGNYTVVATAPNGNNNGNCTASTTVTITQPASTTTVSLVSKTNNTCNGGATGTINVSASGGSGGYSYTITSGPTINTTGAANGMFTGLTAGTYTITAMDANGCSGSLSGITITQPTSTTPDGSVSVADFTDNFFPANASEVTIVFQVTENSGNPITTARLRTTKQGTSYAFSLLNQSSITIGSTTYPLANTNWTQDNSNSTFYDLNMNTGNQVSCGQSVYLAVKITRNTANKSTFTLTSVLQMVAGETATSNNAATFILVAQ